MATSFSSSPRVNGPLQRAIEAILTDRPVAYHAILARAVGSATAGIFLSQMLYWTPRGHDDEGWIWKTQDQIYQETALTRWEQESARKALRKVGVLDEKRAGVPARLYFRIDMEQLTTLLAAPTTPPPSEPPDAEPENEPEEIENPAAQHVGKPHPRMWETDKQGWRFSADKDGGFPQTINGTETTSETTSDMDISKPHAAATKKISSNLSTGLDIFLVGAPRGRPPKPTPYVLTVMTDLSTQLHDAEHTQANVTRAMKLFRASKLAEKAFVGLLYQARDITKRRGNIEKVASTEAPLKNRMPYFFAVVQDLLTREDVPGAARERTAMLPG